MGLIVILLVVGTLAAGSWLLYRRPKAIRAGELPEASLHVKDDMRAVDGAVNQFRDTFQGRGDWG